MFSKEMFSKVYDVVGCGVRSGGDFYPDEWVVFVLVGLRQCDVVHF